MDFHRFSYLSSDGSNGAIPISPYSIQLYTSSDTYSISSDLPTMVYISVTENVNASIRYCVGMIRHAPHIVCNIDACIFSRIPEGDSYYSRHNDEQCVSDGYEEWDHVTSLFDSLPNENVQTSISYHNIS